MIRLSQLTLRRGTRVLLSEASLAVAPKKKIGLIGANGCGKSSLLAVLRGELLAEAGDISLPASWVIATVAQESPTTNAPAIEYVRDGDRHLRELEARLAAADASHEPPARPSEGGLSQPHGEGAAGEPHSPPSTGRGAGERHSHEPPAPPTAGGPSQRHGAGAAGEPHSAPSPGRGTGERCASELTGEALAELHHAFEVAGGYAAPARAAALLAGLGFSEDQARRPVASFSGGWRMRLNLAQALMCPSDLLLLDEPTNHLDLEAVLWLEDWLRTYPGTLLLISHDRDFLDATVDTIVHFDGGQLKSYPGSFATFENQRAQQLALQQSMYNRQQREIEHLQAFVDRFRAKASKARQAQSRLHALERMERIAAAHVDSPFQFSFREPAQAPRQLVSFDHAALGYDAAAPILREVRWSLLAGERVGLLGANGAGKSTLLKAIAGQLAPLSGRRHVGQGLAIGYFAQHQVEQLRLTETPLWHLQRLASQVREQELRDFLGGFDFRGERVLAPVGEFSGGEKARLTLALLVWQKPNLLLLDEPTNHLDLEMRQALTEALQEYTGALVVVAHDRHLLRATTDSFWLVADGGVSLFEGDLDDYRAWVAARRSATASAGAKAKPGGIATDRRTQRRLDAQARARRGAQVKPLRARLTAAEHTIAKLTREKQANEAWLASPEAYAEAGRGRLPELVKRQGELAQAIEAAEHDWLEVHAELDRLELEPAEDE
ncbi:MAG: ATP-binding cassette domain-containing protein [Betaproteobacteria bacterium]|nr:ATP-binding cassette domain-containing protein [Betaproteobacteria bacterium]